MKQMETLVSKCKRVSFNTDVVVAVDGVKSLMRKFVIVSLNLTPPVNLPVNNDEGVPRQPKTFGLHYLLSVVR